MYNKSIFKTFNVTVYILPTGGGYAISSRRKILQYRIYIYYRLEEIALLISAIKFYSMYVDGFSELLCENCTYFQANMTNVIFSCPLLTKNCSCKLVVFKKIASAYQRQIALKIMLLPIQIDDMYNRKQIKTQA